MPWIPVRNDPDVQAAMIAGMRGYPVEYAPSRRAERRVPDVVKADSIVNAHTLVPKALEHVFSALREMYDPALPLSRRQHETIATVVSLLNDCFY
jgi:hypothetical protein